MAATIFVYVVYIALAWYTLSHLPPIPSEVVTQSGQVLFTGQDVVQGKVLMQKYGLFDYGSFWGFGGYMGPEYTAVALQFINASIAQAAAGNVSAYLAMAKPAISGPRYSSALQPIVQGKLIVPDAYAKAYQSFYNWLAQLLYYNSTNNALKPYLVPPNDIGKIAAFIFWGALMAQAGYTNGFPYMPPLTSPPPSVTLASWGMLVALLLTLTPVVAFVVFEVLKHWNDPRIAVQLPPPNVAQRVPLYGVLVAALGLGIQGLLGVLAMHYYVEPQGILGLISWLPFNVARAVHLNLAVIWIALTWISFSVFALPYLGIGLSKRDAYLILGLTLVGGLGIVLGILASYNQLIPSPWWFIFGAQGKPNDVNQGAFWLLWVAAILFYGAYLFSRAINTSPEPVRPLVKILSIALAGTGMGLVFGALPVVQPFPTFTEDQYFSWIMIHALVEGFWPAILTSILLILLVVTGVVPPTLAVIVGSVDATTEIITGMIGTAHHYYFGGEPVFWMYLGAAAAMLEVIPLGLLAVYAILLWRRGGLVNELQKTLALFPLVAGIGGALVGVLVAGGAMLNTPAFNYYLHGTQFTMAHAHWAFPLAYGLPTILLWFIMLYLSGGLADKHLGLLRKFAVIYGIGFGLQAATLWALGGEQLAAELQSGYWAIKGLQFWSQPAISATVWTRLAGDLTAGVAIAVFAVYVLIGLINAARRRIESR